MVDDIRNASKIEKAVNPNSGLVNRIWRLCTLLRKDGVSYQQYVNEITYLIFLKMMNARRLEERLPSEGRWGRLLKAGDDLLAVYRDILQVLRTARNSEGQLAIVFADAATIVRDQSNLKALIEAIDELPWYEHGRDNFGDIYEGILERNAEESKRGAGQYFTPRVVVDAIIQAVRPVAGETIQDPAAGTGGFLIRADDYIRDSTEKRRGPPLATTFVAMENVPDTFRLLLMNLALHEIEPTQAFLGDTLSPDHLKLVKADLILSNPPFGPAGGRPTRTDLEFTSSVSNFQLPFVEHCLRALRPGGRAAIVVPDSVLFEAGRASDLRRYMLNDFDLHTVLRLPSGIFYAAGVKTNVLFLQHRAKRPGTDRTWIYDLRTRMPTFGRSTPLRESALAEFLAFYGTRSDGGDRAGLEPNAADSRYRAFSRAELADADDNLDLTWLQEGSASAENDLTEPRDIAGAIARHLKLATAAFEEAARQLNGAGKT